MTTHARRRVAAIPDWVKDSFDIVVTVAMIALVIGAATVVVQNRRIANDAHQLAVQIHEHERVEARAAVENCYDRHAWVESLRPVVQSIVRLTPDPKAREAARNYIATLEATTPRIADCRRLAHSLGVSP